MSLPWPPHHGDVVDTEFGRVIIAKVDANGVLYRFTDSNTLEWASHEAAKKYFRSVMPSASPSPLPRTDSMPSVRSDRRYVSSMEHQEEALEGSRKIMNALDSLRFGLVPEGHILDLSMFQNELRSFYNSSLPYNGNEVRPKVNLVQGAYGEGKSHAMSYIREMAKANGYIVSSVEVDGESVTLAKPESLMYSISSGMHGNGLSLSHPMVDLITKAIEKDGRHTYTFVKVGDKCRFRIDFDLVKKVYFMGKEKMEEADDFLEDLMTSSQEATATQIWDTLEKWLDLYAEDRPVPLVGREVDNKPLDFIAAMINTARVAEVAGYKGLIITFDEWEVQSFALNARDRQRVERLLRGIEYFFTSEKIRAPISFYIFNVPQASGGGDPLTDTISELVKKSGGMFFDVPTINEWDAGNPEIAKMITTIYSMYKEAYRCNRSVDYEELARRIEARKDWIGWGESGAIRRFSKLIVQVLDEEYGPPLIV